ncbi:MAG: DMT family transporter, partial [bacterium]
HITVVIAALTAVIMFGASPVAAKIAVAAVSAIDVAILRTVIGGLFAIPIALLLGIGFPKTGQQQILLMLSGFCGFVGFPVLFTLGVMLTSANHASMILAALPVFTGAIAMTWDRQRPKPRWWLGCAIALIGEAILVLSIGADNTGASVEGDVLVLLSNLLASLGYVAGGRLQRSGYSAMGTTFWGVGVFAVLLMIALPFVIETSELMTAGPSAWSAIAYLAIGVTIVGYMLWYWALGSGGIARVGLIQFLQPVSGVILAWLLLSETINAVFLLASAVILAGVWVALRAKD